MPKRRINEVSRVPAFMHGISTQFLGQLAVNRHYTHNLPNRAGHMEVVSNSETIREVSSQSAGPG
jgi:hypothetical protein